MTGLVVASDVLLLVGFLLIAAGGFLLALPVGLAVVGVECVALGYLIERRALVAPTEGES